MQNGDSEKSEKYWAVNGSLQVAVAAASAIIIFIFVSFFSPRVFPQELGWLPQQDFLFILSGYIVICFCVVVF